MTYPPNNAVKGWWLSGYDSEDNAVLCAVVDADSIEAAVASINLDWPESGMTANSGYRFIEKKPDLKWVPGDRFPLAGWMKDRL